MRTYVISLPPRLNTIDDDALGLRSAGGPYSEKCYWKIFQDFLDSGNPLALDEQRYTVASLTCLKILFGQYRAPVLRFSWFNRHSRTLRVGMEAHFQWHHTDLPVGIDWGTSFRLYWDLRTRLPNQMRPGTYLSGVLTLLKLSRQRAYPYTHSDHLQFLLQKSAYSDKILDFARYRVFRFGYMHRKHPAYMKEAIFSLAKYIQRVTGEMAEVRACKSVWGQDRWLVAQ